MAKSLMRFDPFRAMKRWEPFSELREFQHEMEKLYDKFLGKEISVSDFGHGTWMPQVESYVKDNSLVFKCECPGVDPKDVDVSFDENTHQLIIKGERKMEKDTNEEDYIYRELSYGNFERRFTLPEGVKTDQVKAKYANGILEITVPAPAIMKAKKIEIEAGKPVEGGVMKKAA